MKTTIPAPADHSAVLAFESRIRQLGEGPARLENLAALVVGLLEARRDHLIEKRAGGRGTH